MSIGTNDGEDELPGDIGKRVEAIACNGRLEYGPVAALLDKDEATTHVDVGNHQWGDVVPLITTVRSEGGEIAASAQLTPRGARDLAEQLLEAAEEAEENESES